MALDIGIRAKILVSLFSKPASRPDWKYVHKLSDNVLFTEICNACKQKYVKPVFKKLIVTIINHREFNGYHVGYRHMMEFCLF